MSLPEIDVADLIDGGAGPVAQALGIAARKLDHRLDVLDLLLWNGSEPVGGEGVPSFLDRLEAVEAALWPRVPGERTVEDSRDEWMKTADILSAALRETRSALAEVRDERDHLRDFKRRAHEALDEIGVDACVGEDCRIVARIRALANRRSQDRPPGMAAWPCSVYGVRDHPAHVWLPRSWPWSPDQTARGVPPGIAWCPGQSST